MKPDYAFVFGPEPLVDAARQFATGAHHAVGQVRKYTGEPYICHPDAVARIVRCAFGSPQMIAAAWLHDVVEDTGVTQEIINAAFPGDVAILIDWMTDKTVLADGNRATRKALERDRWRRAPADAQTIKLADAIDNCIDISAHDPAFSKVYIGEMRQLVHVLDKGNYGLRRQLQLLLDQDGIGRDFAVGPSLSP